jgi:hypothetical protein
MTETSQRQPSLEELRSHVEEPGIDEVARTVQRRMLAHAYELETGGRLPDLQKRIGEWRRGRQFRTDWHNVPEKLMLTVTELSEAMEAYRHLPEPILAWLQAGGGRHDAPEGGEWRVWYHNFVEELADTFIRLADLCDALEINLASCVFAKMGKNELRPIKHGKEC